MSLDYTLLAAKTMAEKGEKEAANGMISTARESFRLAAKKYRQAADMDPAHKNHLIELAEECEAKAEGRVEFSAPAPAKNAPNAGQKPGAPAAPGTPKEYTKQTEGAKESTGAAAKEEEDVSVDEALGRLNALIGLKGVKEQVNNWVAQIRVFKKREELGLPVPDGFSYHLVFTGNPGTGKTTVARFMAQIYKGLGILPQGQLIETARNDLVAGYVGQTAIKTKEVVDKAIGGVLFVDEAYMLKGNGNDFGQEAIDTLLKAMEDHRKELVVIMAGYSGPMADLIETNPGLKSRFNTVVEFEDYTGDELYAIFESSCKKSKYRLNEAAERMMRAYFAKLYANRDKDFGNGRTARNTFQSVVMAQSKRIDRMMANPSFAANIGEADLVTITESDIATATNAFDAGTVEHEKAKAANSDEKIFGLLGKGDLGAAALAVCVRLESALKHLCHLEGDLVDMIGALGSSQIANERRLTRENISTLHKIRMYRNATVHSSENGADLTPTDITEGVRILNLLEA